MNNFEQVLELLTEGHRLWENEQLSDALALMEAATELMPDYPDPWIDIAGLLRAMNHDHKNEALERMALDADRKLIELGEGEAELVAEITLAKKRVSHREAWDNHLQAHLQQETLREDKAKAAAEASAKERDKRLEKEKNKIRAELKKYENFHAEAIANAKKAYQKSLSFFEKRKMDQRLLSGMYDPSHPEAMRAKTIEKEISRLQQELFMVDDRGGTDLYTPQPPSLPPVYQVELLINYFDLYTHLGKSCICGTPLDQLPPRA